jgi:hypothetical protein
MLIKEACMARDFEADRDEYLDRRCDCCDARTCACPTFGDALVGLGAPEAAPVLHVVGCADCGAPVAEDEVRCEPHAEEHLRRLGFSREDFASLDRSIAKADSIADALHKASNELAAFAEQCRKGAA